MLVDLVIDVAVAIIIDSQNRILVNQRTCDREHAGQWEFPGGKFEKSELISQALVRECQEELGITIQEANIRTPNITMYGERGFKVLMKPSWAEKPKSRNPTRRSRKAEKPQAETGCEVKLSREAEM